MKVNALLGAACLFPAPGIDSRAPRTMDQKGGAGEEGGGGRRRTEEGGKGRNDAANNTRSIEQCSGRHHFSGRSARRTAYV
eukprot:8801594-Pyramimonas_sp.AAC.1